MRQLASGEKNCYHEKYYRIVSNINYKHVSAVAGYDEIQALQTGRKS